MISKHSTTEYNRFKRVEGRFRDLMSRLIHFKETQDWYHSERVRITESEDFRKLSSYYRGKLYGQEEARRDLLDSHVFGINPLTEYRFWYQGEFRPLTWLKDQRKIDEDIDRKILYDVEYRQSGHFWNNSNRPYYLSDKEPAAGNTTIGGQDNK